MAYLFFVEFGQDVGRVVTVHPRKNICPALRLLACRAQPLPDLVDVGASSEGHQDHLHGDGNEGGE